MERILLASIQHETPLYHPRFHPTLPLLATLDACHLAVHVWTWRDGNLIRLASLGEPRVERGARQYSGGHDTMDIAWHPTHPLLAVAGLGGVRLWECFPKGEPRDHGIRGLPPPGERTVEVEEVTVWSSREDGGLEPVTRQRTVFRTAPDYSAVGFIPSGEALWASPADNPEEKEGWGSDLFSTQEGGPESKHGWWDTDLALHPEGVLMATFESNQGATLLKFASMETGPEGAQLQTWKRTLLLDVDGYEGLSFSPRGDMILFRGNAYEDVGYVHEFPSLKLRHILPLAPERDWFDKLNEILPESWRQLRWSFLENLAFTPDNQALLLGMRSGHLIEFDLETGQPINAEKIHTKPICAIRVRHRDGLLAVMDFEGLLRLYQLPHSPVYPNLTSRPLTTAFLASTEPAPRGAEWDDLSLTDGLREWDEETLQTEEIPEDAPTWAQLGATLKRLTNDP